ncbi:MAG: YitT family protein [Bacteroidales bacterium]|nr:YitT family protein [Bacteroidales bacterium]
MTVKNNNFKKEFFSYFLVILGSALFAAGDVMFVNPYHLAPGGTYGLSNVLNTVWPWRISYYAICMDIPLLLIGTWILGPRFGVKTVLSTILIFVFTWVLESVWGYDPVVLIGQIVKEQPQDLTSWMDIPHGGGWFMPDFVVNTILSGLIYGVAIGLIFKGGATSGGSDIISMILHKYTKISLGTLVMIVDGCITLSTLIAFKQVRLPVYSILIIAIESYMIDLIVDGLRTDKTLFIVTDKYDTVREFILNDLHRGGTAILGQGLYQGKQRHMIYCNLSRADFVKLKSNLRFLDPDAFVNVVNSSEIMGRGFRTLPLS